MRQVTEGRDVGPDGLEAPSRRGGVHKVDVQGGTSRLHSTVERCIIHIHNDLTAVPQLTVTNPSRPALCAAIRKSKNSREKVECYVQAFFSKNVICISPSKHSARTMRHLLLRIKTDRNDSERLSLPAPRCCPDTDLMRRTIGWLLVNKRLWLS